MAARHKFAVEAVNTTNVIEVARLLAMATQDANAESKHPHEDAACRVIAAHIAGLCNADLHFLPHYTDCFVYCCKMAELDVYAAPDKEWPEEPKLTPN